MAFFIAAGCTFGFIAAAIRSISGFFASWMMLLHSILIGLGYNETKENAATALDDWCCAGYDKGVGVMTRRRTRTTIAEPEKQ